MDSNDQNSAHVGGVMCPVKKQTNSNVALRYTFRSCLWGCLRAVGCCCLLVEYIKNVGALQMDG